MVSVTPFKLGGFGANHHLRQALVYLDLVVLAQPEMYIANAGTLFNADGGFASDDTKKLFTRFGAAFTAWVGQHRAK